MEPIIMIDQNGNIENPLYNIMAARMSLKNIEEAIENAGSEEEIAELDEERENMLDMLDVLYWEFGNSVGYETLSGLRKFWGVQISMHNVLQEKHYKLQKARYEQCKRVVCRFTQDDRAFIEEHKTLNEKHMELRWLATDIREIFSDIIDAAFPDAPFDLGWDEHWEEQVTA
jgi:hypothetical protein